jgi:hypothetical protein
MIELLQQCRAVARRLPVLSAAAAARLRRN